MPQHQKNGGFTIIEIIVSAGIFSIILIAITGALFLALQAHQVALMEKSSGESVRFALEFMSRQLRFAQRFEDIAGQPTECVAYGVSYETPVLNEIHFINSQAQCIRFYWDSAEKNILYQDISTATPPPPINLTNPSQVDIDFLQFIIAGESHDDGEQPRVTIVIQASKTGAAGSPIVSFNAQTSVTQRHLDTILLNPDAGWWSTSYLYRREIVFGTTHSSLPLHYTATLSMDTSTNVVLVSGNDVRVVWHPNAGVSVELDRIGDVWDRAGTKIDFRLQSEIPANLNQDTDGSYYVYYGYGGAFAPPIDEMNVYYFADFFNRADNEVVGNGWTEWEIDDDDASIFAGALFQNGNDVAAPSTGVKQNFAPGPLTSDFTLTWDWTIPVNSQGRWGNYVNLGDAMSDASRTTGVALGLYSGEGTADGFSSSSYNIDDNMSPPMLEIGINGSHSFRLSADLADPLNKTFDYYRDQGIGWELISPVVAFLDSGVPLSQIRIAQDEYTGPDMQYDTVKLVLDVDIDPAVVSGTEEIQSGGGPSAPTIDDVTEIPDSVDQDDTVIFSVDWSDADGEPVRVIICKTDALTGGLAPSCPGGTWTGPSLLFGTTPINLSYTTTIADFGTNKYYAFACDDPGGQCSPGFFGNFRVVTPGNDPPSISFITDSPDPVDVGDIITFTVNWSDANGDSVNAIVCKDNAVSAGPFPIPPSCPGAGGIWTGPETDASPIDLLYTAQLADVDPSNNYYAFVCDVPAGDCSVSVAGTFEVLLPPPNTPPSIDFAIDDGPVTEGSPVTFTVDWNDPGDLVRAYICTSNLMTTPQSCDDGSWTQSDDPTVNDPIFLTYDTLSADVGPNSYWVFVCDEDDACSSSTSGNFTVNTGGSGTILREYWIGIGGTAVSDLTGNANYPDSPSGSDEPTLFEAPTDWTDNYGTRMRGYVHPPATGAYTFWIASDDNGELWLSTDDDPANAILIASVPAWTSSRQWDKYIQQQSSPITLTAGQKYYIEALQKEAGGLDNLAVAWQSLAITQAVIDGPHLSPWVETAGAAFQQDSGPQGIVSIEAENYDSNVSRSGKDWVADSTIGHSGDGALKAMPNSGTNYLVYSDVANSPELGYEVSFTKTGLHYVWVRGFAPDESGGSPSQPIANNDSVHAGFDGTAFDTSDRIDVSFTNSWGWSKALMGGGNATINIPTTGVHTFNIWMREDGFIIDKIVLTTDPTFTPSGAGPPESPRGSVTINFAPSAFAIGTNPDVSGTADRHTTFGTLPNLATDDGVYAGTDLQNPNIVHDPQLYWTQFIYDLSSLGITGSDLTSVTFDAELYMIGGEDQFPTDNPVEWVRLDDARVQIFNNSTSLWEDMGTSFIDPSVWTVVDNADAKTWDNVGENHNGIARVSELPLVRIKNSGFTDDYLNGSGELTIRVMNSGALSDGLYDIVHIYDYAVVTIAHNPPSASTESRISQGSDDAEEDEEGGPVNLTSSDLELVFDGTSGDQTIGMRFQNMNIPQGATITNAYIEFTTDNDDINSEATDLTFRGEDADDTVTFASTSGDISSRSQTTAFVDWPIVPEWTLFGEKHQTPDLSPIIQEIVNRGLWLSGNAMVIIVTGTGERTAESFNGEAANAPLLHVDFIP